jgi:hypothetical protein
MGNTARHRWIYAGLALADGVGLVSAPERSAPPSQPPPPPAQPTELPTPAQTRRPLLLPGQQAALFGDALAAGLVVALTHLTNEARVPLYAQARRDNTVEDWVVRGWFADVLRDRPQVILGAFRWAATVPAAAMHRIEELATERAARMVWLAPPGATEAQIVGVARALNELRAGRPYWPHRLFRSDGLTIPVGPDGATPSAMGFAGWAGALWAYLSSAGRGSLSKWHSPSAG